MAEVASAFVSIMPSAKGFGGQLERDVSGGVAGAGRSLGRTFGKLFVAAAGALAAVGVGRFLKGSIDEAREAQKVTAATNAIIKATGGVANVAANQVAKLAESISLKTGIDDEAIQSGENLLLTFKNVRNEVGEGNNIFAQATQAAVDLSAAGFGSIDSASKMLGKALNDPLKGLTALGRAGVTFTQTQQDRIKKYVEEGKLLQAQKIIMGEVQSQVGGVAEATATAGEKAKVAWDNIKEQIGTALLPVLDKALNAFVAFSPTISKGIAKIGPAFGQVADFIAPVVAKVQGLFSGGGAGGGFLDGLKSFGAAVQANFLPVLQTMAATFQTVILPAVVSFGQYLAANLLPVFQQVGVIIRDQVLPILASLAQFFYGTIYPAVAQIVAAVAEKLQPVFEALVASFEAHLLPTLQLILSKFKEWQPTIQAVVAVLVQIVGKVLEFAAAIAAKVLPPLIQLSGWLAEHMVKAIILVIEVVAKIVQKLIGFGQAVGDLVGDVADFVLRVKAKWDEAVQDVAKFVVGVRQKFSNAIDFIKGIPGKITSALGDLGDLLLDIGKSIINGLLEGMKDAWNGAADWLGGLGGAIKGLKGPPEKDKVLLRPIGALIMDGLRHGFEDGWPAVQDRLGEITQGIVDKLGELRDKAKSKIDSLKQEFTSLRDSIATAFTPDLFQATSVSDFFAQGQDAFGTLVELRKALKKLRGWGLDPKFLAQLFASGNSALILDLAGGTRAGALDAAALFQDVGNLSQQLGRDLAQDVIGPELKQANRRLERIEDAINALPKKFGRELNGAASDARKRAA